MKKIAAATVVLSMVALVFTTAPVVSADVDDSERMDCVAEITYDFSPGVPNPHWIGAISGCALDGATLEFWEKPDNFVVGASEHFFETMLITIGSDTIKGYDAGLWNFATFKFRANGFVTEATGDWAYLVGYKVHEMGFTTAFPPPEGVYVIQGTAAMWFAAE